MMNKNVYAIWLGDAWFTSASPVCLQKKAGGMPLTVFESEDAAYAAYNEAVNCGAVIHEEGNDIVRIQCERV